jgi:hypothetical protein
MATVLKTILLPEETIAGLDALVAAGHAETREALVAESLPAKPNRRPSRRHLMRPSRKVSPAGLSK